MNISRCFAGQSNDGIFKFAKAGKVTCKLDKVKEVLERSIVLCSGEEVPADLIVFAYGLKYQAEPECLKELGIGMAPHFVPCEFPRISLYLLSTTISLLSQADEAVHCQPEAANLADRKFAVEPHASYLQATHLCSGCSFHACRLPLYKIMSSLLVLSHPCLHT